MASYGIQAYGQYQAGKAQKAALNYQASVDKYNAKLEMQAAEEEALMHRGGVHSLISSQRAQYSAGGIDANQGSALEVMASTAYEGEMDAQRILYGGKIASDGLKMSARLRKYEGKVALMAAKIQATATVAKGAETGAMMVAASDERVKKDIVDLTPYLFRYKQEYIDDDNQLHVGVMAQDLEKIHPSLVIEKEINGEMIKHVDYAQLSVLLLMELKARTQE
jgi:hypothetical protein